MESWLPEGTNEFYLPTESPICYVGTRKQNIDAVAQIVNGTFGVTSRVESLPSYLPNEIDDRKRVIERQGGLFVTEATRQHNLITVQSVLKNIRLMMSYSDRTRFIPLVIVDPRNAHTIHYNEDTDERTFTNPEGPKDLIRWLKYYKIPSIVCEEGEVNKELEATLARIKSCLGKSGIQF